VDEDLIEKEKICVCDDCRKLVMVLEDAYLWDKMWEMEFDIMAKKKDLTGRVFGNLLVVDLHEMKNHRAYWLCDCICGEKAIVPGSKLVNKSTRSCGCLRKENTFGRREMPTWL